MSIKRGWLFVLVAVALLVAACGPEMATPTPRVVGDTGSSPTASPASRTAEPEPSASEPEDVKPPASAGDWNVRGSSDAQITIIEYSDFQ